MPRPLAFGNGRLQVLLDHRGNLRDLSWPIGIWNHLAGRAIRMGVWVEGGFVWLDSAGWERTHQYGQVDGTLAGRETHEHGEVGLRLEVVEGVAPDRDTFWRRLRVANLRDTARDVRLFVTADLRVMESDIGDCVFWHPELNSLIHYKGGVVIQIHLEGGDQYACGITEFGGAEGTWRDAEDGELSMNPIAQGSVDSAVRSSMAIAAHGYADLSFAISVSKSVDCLQRVSIPGGAFLPLEATNPVLHRAVIETHVSASGAILAANDSDIMATNRANYAYCWVRDGVHIAETMATFDGGSCRDRFVRWALALLDERPYFLQKYRADGTFGASWHPWTKPLPIQLDETASFLSLLCHLDSPPPGSTAAIERIGTFLERYQADNLPLPSYDLWEEQWGIHIYTVCTVIRALRDAGLPFLPMRDAMISHFWTGTHFRRSLEDDRPDSASLFVGLLDVLPMDDARVQANAEAVREALWVKDGLGGVARYPGDYYFRRNERHPGNPWVICTLWLAQHDALSGRLDAARRLLQWVNSHADSTGVLPEQLDPDTGAHLSVSPLTWSHAEYLRTLQTIQAASAHEST